MVNFATSIIEKLVAMICPRCSKPTLTMIGETHLGYPAYPERSVRSHRFWRCNCGKIISRSITLQKV